MLYPYLPLQAPISLLPSVPPAPARLNHVELSEDVMLSLYMPHLLANSSGCPKLSGHLPQEAFYERP